MNPTMKAINERYRQIRKELSETTIRTPCKTNGGWSYFFNPDDVLEPPRYTGYVKKIGDKRSIIDYMKDHGEY